MKTTNFWQQKNILITGHTGFKGSWLSLLLKELGANVYGVSNSSWPSCPIHNHLKARDVLKEELDYDLSLNFNEEIDKFIVTNNPDIVFHLAAQPLVLHGYRHPSSTWKTNLVSTLNLLDCFGRLSLKPCIVVVTTDKVYKNKEWYYPYRETDELGGLDPYSASKASVELLIASWINSYCQTPNTMRLATARAGNVIGGGDFAADRIIPDIVNSIENRTQISLRNPNAIRPWQHVLDPLYGYLVLAEKLYSSESQSEYQSSFNFGPSFSSFKTVSNLVNEFRNKLPEHMNCPHFSEIKATHQESQLLSLDSTKSHTLLDWYPKWDFKTSVEKTAQWYSLYLEHQDLYSITLKDVHSYLSNLSE